ncbi:recombinase family protein [Phocaeicola coprocola]|uniref:recombinase family protein n=2 Tax=Phocaeicola coprocola TaxID=310298 RepID=UPI00195C0AC4|nr:recombinase family protein [Phocaeicola coprocola]MBM6714726.1 recombinase family protein [Phocaeicola coprocola]
MKIGYARVSTLEQNLDRQIDQLEREGCERIYSEKASGTRNDRPELHRMLDALRPGDIVIVSELTRLSRTSRFLIDLVDRLSQIGVNIKSLKEQWFDTTTPHGRLIFTVFAGLSQFERDLAQLRTREGLEAARARGRKGGRPKKDSKTIELALKLYDSQTCTIAEITRTTGVSKATLYQYINNRKKNNH